MTYNETLAWMHSMPRTHSAPTLSRVEHLLSMMGNPEKKLARRFIHVTGTNGKGSFCAFVSSALQKAGYRVGRFISPFIMEFRERMEIGGVQITEEEVASLGDEIRVYVERYTQETGESPIEFELVTLMGFLWFSRQGCDLVVLEVGIGGMYDPTNVVSPLLSVIMRVDYDHTELLGNTLTEIARHKSGIIKAGAPCVLYADNEKEVIDVIREKCASLHTPLVMADRNCIRIGEATPSNLPFTYKQTSFRLRLSGTYQIENAVTAIEALRALSALGFPITEEQIESGLAATAFPARFEVLSHHPLFILDGAHNASGIHAMAENIRFYFDGKPLFYLIGMLRDKHPADVLAEVMTPDTVKYIACITPPSPRAMPAEELATALSSYGMATHAFPDIPSALDSLRAMAEVYEAEHGEPVTILCFGSLYSAGDVRRTCNVLHKGSIS